MDPEPTPLPMAGAPPERADAAVNRVRILCAARALVDAGGVDALRMDAVAAAAGVGKGTVFRRFGDRAGLRAALVDEAMRAFQDAFLAGPPPLGPGAPPQERLEAFLVALLRWHRDDVALAQLAETPIGEAPTGASRSLTMHVGGLLADLGVDQPEVVGPMLLAAVSPSALHGIELRSAPSQQALEDAVLVLVRGLVRGADGRPA